MIEPNSIKRILVLNLGGIGDVLISTPALRALKEHFSGCQLYLLVVGRVIEIARDLAYIDKVFVFEAEHPWLNLFVNLKNIFQLRKLKIDLGINMRTLVECSSARKIEFILGLIKPRIIAGRDTAGRGSFFDISIFEEDISDKYEMEYDLEIVQSLGAKVNNKKIDFIIDTESFKSVENLLSDNSIGPLDILIGLHPGGRPSRRWHWEKFSEVMKILQREIVCKFVITGSKDEVELARGIINESGVKALNLAGKLNIRELGAFLKRCDLYITNDTGSMHIASIMNTPLVAIFGPGYLKRYDPRNISAKTVVFYKKEECSPCNKFDCESKKCLESISVSEVVEAARELLTQNKRIG